MASDFAARRAAFRKLHESGCFVIPSHWTSAPPATSAIRIHGAGHHQFQFAFSQPAR
jgi:hypothetical protein